MTNFEEFKERILKDPKVKKHYDKIAHEFKAFKTKIYCFTIKDFDDELFSFELESDKTLEEVVKTSEFIDKLEENNFFPDDDVYESLESFEWGCYSFQTAKGITKEETFDIYFTAEKIWTVE